MFVTFVADAAIPFNFDKRALVKLLSVCEGKFVKFEPSPYKVSKYPLANLVPFAPISNCESFTGTIFCTVKVAAIESFASDLTKLAEDIPSSVSASNPLPAPSTVLRRVKISLAD